MRPQARSEVLDKALMQSYIPAPRGAWCRRRGEAFPCTTADIPLRWISSMILLPPREEERNASPLHDHHPRPRPGSTPVYPL